MYKKERFILTKRYWWILIIYAIAQFSVLAIAPLLFKLTSWNELEASIYGNIFSLTLGFIIILYLLKDSMREGLRAGIDISQTAVWVVFGVFMAYATQIIASLIEVKVLGIKTSSQNTAAIMEFTRQIPLFAILTTIVAPVLEEIVFRKIIFGSLYKKTNFFIAGVISAIIFGIVHGEPKHLLIYASMGFVFAYLYIRTKTLLTPILVHIILNTITVIVQYNFTPEQIQQQLEQLHVFIGG